MRKLVTVRRVVAIEPIPGADFIEKITVDGWKCVAKKGHFSVGDQCLYFEIDSFLLEGDSRFDFLMKDKIEWEGKVGVRIRTLVLRKQVSQGLALPISDFPEILDRIYGMSEDHVREIDFTDVLGVQKWERPIPREIAEMVVGAMPSYIKKTDEERIQNITEILTDQAEELFEETIKLNGYSMTIFSCDAESGVCMRNWWFKPDLKNVYTEVADKFGLIDAVRRYHGNIAVQGELIGPGVCGNQERLEDLDFRVFKIFNIDERKYYTAKERSVIIDELRSLGATVREVPRLRIVRLGDFSSVDEILAHANGPSLNPNVRREGLVYNRIDGSESFKVISNEFLCKNTDE